MVTLLAIIITIHAVGGLGFAWVCWAYYRNLFNYGVTTI